jgi:cell division protein FtsQ
MRRLIALLLLLLGVSGWLLGWSPYLRVETIAVTGLGNGSPLTSQQILTQAELGEGMAMARVSEPAVRRALQRIPRVGDVDVIRQWPRSVEVRITERVPWAVVRVLDALYFVDAAGNFFAKVGTPARTLPLVTLPTRSVDSVRDLVTVTNTMPQSLRNEIVEMSAPTRDQLTIDLLLNGRETTLVWGSVQESALKVRVLQELLQRKESVRWSVIDLSAPRAPTTR